MDTVLPSLFLQVILIASNAFFAMSEFAVVSVKIGRASCRERV